MPGRVDDSDPNGIPQKKCNLQLGVLEHVKQRTCVWEKIGALSRRVFDWTEEQRMLLGGGPNC